MIESVNVLVVDFLEWLAAGPKPYAEVMEVWRTSCPRLTVWEDAVDRGLVARRLRSDGQAEVALTASGLALVDARAVSRLELID
jgi:hypothetical protein